MVQITGTITSPEAVRTHTDTSAPKAAGAFAGGSTVNVHIGVLTNTGNVPQTVTAGAVDNLANCKLDTVGFLDNNIPVDSPFTLAPGASTTLYASVTLPDEDIGTPDTAFSFDVEDTVWS